MTNSVNPDQTAPIGSGPDPGPPCLFLSLNSSVILGNYLQQMTSADEAFFLGALRANISLYL